ncbi:hypothetical protein A8B78_09420 [Jannaschia sp. EhC01]|nr:hypothetical protein A8B78_09420 [Jannaschia sp. EhC01]
MRFLFKRQTARPVNIRAIGTLAITSGAGLSGAKCDGGPGIGNSLRMRSCGMERRSGGRAAGKQSGGQKGERARSTDPFLLSLPVGLADL